MAFWNDSSVEPKRSFRWLLYLPTSAAGAQGFETYVVKDVSKPQYVLTETPVKYIAHTFKYPGRLTWSNVTCNLIDPIYPDTSGIITKVLQASGYKLPENNELAQFSFSKRTAVNALGTPRLVQIDGGDVNNNIPPAEVEEWTLTNAWLSNVNFGTLNYTSEDLVSIGLTIVYDFARYRGVTTAITSGNTQRPGKLKDIMY